MSEININNVTLDYSEKDNVFTALKNVSFKVDSGEFVSVIGPSGCGKSTLLSILAGLTKSSEGNIYVNDNEITGPGINRGVVFQNYSLFPWLTAIKNVMLAVKQSHKKISRKETERISKSFLEKVGLAEFKDKYPSQLSGGMQQRVAIAKTLAMNTPILLMDEPFGAVDPKNRVILQNLLLELWEGESKKEKKTIVFVTHDIDEAIILSDKIVMMAHSPGRVYKEVKVPFEHPRNREELVNSVEYRTFRNKLVEDFYNGAQVNLDNLEEDDVLNHLKGA